MNGNKSCLSVGERFAEERERLKLTQSRAAEACGVSRQIIGRYERGVTTPGSEPIAALGRLGADMVYILTGRRQTDPTTVDLSPEELLLLDMYRALPIDMQGELRGFARAMLNQAVKEGRSSRVRRPRSDEETTEGEEDQ